MSKAIMKLDKIFAEFEKKAEESQIKCENKIKTMKKDITRNTTKMENEIKELKTNFQRNLGIINTLQKEINEFNINLQKSQSSTKTEVLNTIIKDISNVTKQYNNSIEILEAQKKMQTAMQSDINDMNIIIGNFVSSTEKDFNELRKNYNNVHDKFNVISKDLKEFKIDLNSTLKQELSDIIKKSDLDTYIKKELKDQKQKLNTFQNRINDLNLNFAEGNKINSLNLDNLSFQIKNLVRIKGKSPTRIGTPCGISKFEDIKTNKKQSCKNFNKENTNKSFVLTDASNIEQNDVGRKLVVRLARNIKPKTPARLEIEQSILKKGLISPNVTNN